MEEESQEILLKSLHNAGLSIPSGNISSVRELTPATLVPICSQCLNLIDDTKSEEESFYPTSLPDSMVDKFKICTDIALAIKRLGYIGDMSYYKLLYPSEEDLYKVVRFLVERLSEKNAHAVTGRMERADTEVTDIGYQREKLEDLGLGSEVPGSSNSEAEDESFSKSRALNFFKDELTTVSSGNLSAEEGKLMGSEFGNEENGAQEDDEDVLKVTSHRDQINYKTGNYQHHEKVLVEGVTSETELRDLEEEYQLLKTAADMVFADQRPIDFYVEQLNGQLDARKSRIAELESQWDEFRKPLEEKKRTLEQSLYANMPEAQEKLQQLREMELEKLFISSETRRREEEHCKLSADLEKQPRLPSRTSYIERIKEITKNSRKQDADIERIMKDTRELQLESNSIQERLHRTYAVLDEIVFREAKKDPVGRQAYRLLTSLHESFEQISEKILTTDRIRREMADYEKKLATMVSKSVNLDKLQADLDAIKKENEHLEHHTQEN